MKTAKASKQLNSFCTFFAFLVPFVTALFNGGLRPLSHAEDGPWNWSETFVLTNYGLATHT